MTSYNRTIIVNANSIDKIDDSMESNDFTVTVPQVNIPRGATIVLDGAICEERSAGSDSVIELSNQNVSEQKKYTSSWQMLEIRYYLNNASFNSISQPCIQGNYVSLLADTRTPPQWIDEEYFPNTMVYCIPYKGVSVRIDQISGPIPLLYNVASPTPIPTNYDSWIIHNRGVWAYDNPKFIEWDITANAGQGGFINIGGFFIADPDTPPTDITYQQNGDGFAGMVGIKSALKKNMPDSSKYTYMKSGYLGPDIQDTSMPANINKWVSELQIYTDFIEIDMSKDLLETPDEINLLINNKLQGSEINSDNNLEKVMAHTRQWNLNYSTPNLYPEGSLQEVTNISSKTLINIPANFQTTETSKVYGNGFFVKDSDRWIGGNDFLKLCNYRLTLDNINYSDVEGNNPEDNYKALVPITEWDIMFNHNAGDDSKFSRLFPAISAFSMVNNENWIYPFYISAPESVTFQFIDDAPPNWDIQGITGFERINTDTTRVTITNTNNVFFMEHGVGLTPAPGEVVQYRMCRYGYKDGKTIINMYPAVNNGARVIATSTVPDFYFYFGKDFVNQTNLEIVSYQTEISYLLTVGFNGVAGPFRQREDVIINGLPYYKMDGSTGGGRLANENINVTIRGKVIGIAEVDEFLCIPERYLIPSNILTRGIYTTRSISRVESFFRKNEKYAGNKKTFIEQQSDNENWYIDLDLGFADDFNNAMSNFMSSKSTGIPNGVRTIDFTIYNEQQNFSLIPPYYSPITSKNRYVIANPIDNRGVGFNFRDPLSIYPISRYASMGVNYRTNENYIRVHSRYFDGLRNAQVSNANMDVDFIESDTFNGTSRMRSHPMIEFNFDGIFKLAPQKNLAIAECNVGDSEATLAFFNFKPTFKGDGKTSVLYDLNKLDTETNWRQSFRLLHCVPFGFDPASTTNPFMNSANLNQTTSVNPILEAKNFYSNRTIGLVDNQPTEVELPAYSDNICYSGRVEDYVPYIYIGATVPALGFSNSRMEFTNMYTPRKFNAWDSNGSGNPNLGLNICFFNDPTPFFPMLNNTFGSVPAIGPAPNNSAVPSAINQPADFQQVRNKGICDSLSGIGIENLYVRDEDSYGTNPEDDGVLLCIIDNLDKTYNFDGCMFNLFGFALRQFKPYYGLSYNRYSQSNYNNIDDLKYSGINFFTVNSFINQSNVQNMSIFGPNYLATIPSGITTIPNPPAVAAQPEYGLGYIGFQPSTIQVSTDRIRAEDLASKLQNAFYMVYTNLPNSRYITNNSELNIIGTFYRQYKSGNFYFTYPQSYSKTITKEFNLSSIRVSILNSNGRPAENLGNKVSCFFKISIPTVLPAMQEEEVEQYQEATENPKPLQFQNPLDDLRQEEFQSIERTAVLTGMPIMDVNPVEIDVSYPTPIEVQPQTQPQRFKKGDLVDPGAGQENFGSSAVVVQSAVEVPSEADIALRNMIDFASNVLEGAPGLLERNDPVSQRVIAEARPRVERMVAEQRRREKNVPEAEAEKPEQKDED